MSDFPLPDDLPVPQDDGACDHLVGMALPRLGLRSTDGIDVDLSELPGRTVLYCYPATGVPGAPLPEGWNEIPGARGCTPQACAFRDHHAELRALGADVFGLSVQTFDEQREAAERLQLTFPLLSDEELAFSRALRLPTFDVGGRRYLKRATLICRAGTIERVFYPVFPPDENAREVVDWLGYRPPEGPVERRWRRGR